MVKSNYFVHPFGLENHVVSYNDKPIGILNPAVLISTNSRTKVMKVIGPRGAVYVNKRADDFALSLIANNSILLGNKTEIETVQNLLSKPETSRTTAYLCCIVRSCLEITNFFERISNSKVTLIGCGGIGSLSAIILAGSGVKNIQLIDQDRITLSNFNRQFFWTFQDIGLYKVDVLKKRIRERYPDVNVSIHKKIANLKNLDKIIENADGTLFTADEPIGLIKKARKIAEKYRKIFVGGGYVMSEGVISCSSYIRKEDFDSISKIADGIAPSFGPTNVEVAGACSNYLLMRLSGFIEKQKVDFSWDIKTWPWKL